MPVDEDGFLDGATPIRTVLSDAEPGDLLSLRAAAEAHALVVLGEPGLGKSTALRVIADGLRAEGTELVWLDGANLVQETFVEELGAYLSRLPFLDAPEGHGGEGLTVVLDALDESAMVRRIPRRLRETLAGRDLSSLHLIVGCRTADLPADLAETLEHLFPDGTVFADLAPLRRIDAVHLASSLGADGEHLVAAAAKLGAGSLAAIPLTLGLLASDFVEKGVLGLSARELFDRGVMKLLDTTTSVNGPGISTVDQRRAVAERIAAVMLLSGKRTVFVGGLDVAQDLRASDVSDGVERTASGQFPVTPSMVRETLATALFSGRGPDRLAFVHASQAAYLAACYLRRHQPKVPRRQLEGLLLVAAPDRSRTIPVPLRELAAWLVSLDPTGGVWLAETDPESMVGHESYLQSEELRATVVSALFARAAEFELGDRHWTRTIDLAHPGLASQVLGVLNQFTAQPAEWKDFARCRIALRLASHATSSELTERLLQIAKSRDWNAHLGSLAVEAVLASDPAMATPHLRQLLQELGDPEFARTRDPDDEVRGHLLVGLWPQHISTTDVLPALTPRRSGLLGMYWSFLRKFPEQVPGADLPHALRWAAVRAHDEWAAASPANAEHALLADERPIGAVDALLVEGLIARAVGSGQGAESLAYAAALTWPLLDRYDHPTIPPSLDERAAYGPTAAARRAFAEALLRHRATTAAAEAKVDTWRVVHGWRSSVSWSDGEAAGRSLLVDATDFEWAVERAKELDQIDPPVAALMAELAGYLFDPRDAIAVELASGQRGTIVWKPIAHWFEEVELASELADRLRQEHSWTNRLNDPDEDTALAAGVFREQLMDHFAAVVGGEWTRFSRLAWDLQFSPETAHGRTVHRDRLTGFPGMSVLPADAPAQMLACAREFLLNEHDHADDWLGTDSYDPRAWAGYLALALLDEMGELESVPAEYLASWVGAVLWFWSVPSETGDPERKGRFVARAVAADASRMATLLPRYVRGELRRGASALEVQSFDPEAVKAIQSTWTDMVVELHAALTGPDGTLNSEPSVGPLVDFPSHEARVTARYTWQRMFRALALADPPSAERLAISWATDADDPNTKALAAIAMAVLLSTEPGVWRRLAVIAQADDELGREVVAAVVDDHDDAGLLAELDERELLDLYVWLTTIYPPDEDEPEQLGPRWVTPAARARHWRDGVLTSIANRGTEDSVLVLSGLHELFPGRVIVLSNLIRARSAAFATAWEPPSASEVQALLEDSRRRLVRSAEELGLLIQEVLQVVEADFVRTGQLLWDRLLAVDGAPRPWAPKPEAALSAFLAHDLQLRLEDRGVAVHREVLVKPTDEYGAGDRPDILVEARSRSDQFGEPPVVRVAIEVKGAWNPDVLTAQRDQLAFRYLPECATGVGLYIVGWFPIELWDTRDYRRARAAKLTTDELLEALSLQADEIGRAHSLAVTPIVLTVERPAPNGPADAA